MTRTPPSPSTLRRKANEKANKEARLKRKALRPRKAKRRPVSVLKPDNRKDRNADPVGKAFMEWVHGFCCVTCNLNAWRFYTHGDDWRYLLLDSGLEYAGGRDIQFAHIGGGIAGKAANRRGLPLCQKCHTGEEWGKRVGFRDNISEHRLKRNFGETHEIDVAAIIERLFELFTAEEG